MKYQVLFSLKDNEKVFINVVCCSRDWRFKGSESLDNTQIKKTCEQNKQKNAFDTSYFRDLLLMPMGIFPGSSLARVTSKWDPASLQFIQRIFLHFKVNFDLTQQ